MQSDTDVNFLVGRVGLWFTCSSSVLGQTQGGISSSAAVGLFVSVDA